MFVIKSGFNTIRDVALATHVIAIRNGESPLTPAAAPGLQFGGSEGPHDRFTWDVELWPLTTQAQPRRYSHAAYFPEGFEFDPISGELLFCTRSGLHESEFGVRQADGRVVAAAEPGVQICTFTLSRDADRLLCIAATRDNHAFDIPSIQYHFLLFKRDVNLNWQQEHMVYYGTDRLTYPCYLPDGNRVLATGYEHRANRLRTHEYDIPVQRIFDARTYAFLETVEVSQHDRAPYFCGQWLATFGGRSVLLYDTNDFTRNPVQLKNPSPKVSALATDIHGRFLLTAAGHRVQVWDTKSWTITKTYNWKAGAITCLAVAPDGLTATAGTNTGKVVIWDMD